MGKEILRKMIWTLGWKLIPTILASWMWRLERLMFETSPGNQLLSTPPISTNKKQSMVACVCHLSYMGGINRRIVVHAGPAMKVTPF
jgi:hypothetical protein